MDCIHFEERLLRDNKNNSNINMYIIGSVVIFSVSLKWHCQVHSDEDTQQQWQWQYSKIFLAQQGICLPIIRDLVAVCKVKSPSQHCGPCGPIARDSAFVSLQRKTQGLLTPSFTLTAGMQSSVYGLGWACWSEHSGWLI